jgi:hypothetical protein
MSLEHEISESYTSEHLVSLAICLYEGGPQSTPTLSELENALDNLLESGDSQDQLVARIIQDDLYLMIPANTQASDYDECDIESESEEELNTAFNSTPIPPFTTRISPVFDTPLRQPPSIPLVKQESDRWTMENWSGWTDDQLDDTIEWAEDAFDAQACILAAKYDNVVAASYDTLCKCCNKPINVMFFR